MFKIVKSAKVEVIKPHELKEGDYILWANWKRKVIKINRLNRFIVVSNPYDNSEETLNVGLYMNYYKIVSCEEIEAQEENIYE